MTAEHDPKPTRTSTVDAADELRKEWQMNGRPEDAPAVPEGVDTAELGRLLNAWDMAQPGSGAMHKAEDLKDFVSAFGAQQREAGRREGRKEIGNHVKDCLCIGLEVSEGNTLRELLWLTQSRLIELKRANAALAARQSVSALTDEQIIGICEENCGWLAGALDAEIIKFARALLAASPKVEPEPDPRAEFNELQFNAQRLRNVVTLLGMENEVPQSNAGLDGARGAVLGQIAAKLRAKVEPVSDDQRDAERYRWLRDPDTDVALVIDKQAAWVPPDEAFPGIGGYHCYEYRSGEELDAAVDAAITAAQPQPKPETKK